jgi:phage FluMu gp28-like protein
VNLANVLLSYQQAWLADAATVKVCEKSRRIGLTWTEALDSVLHAAPKVGAQNTWYVGYNREMAKEYIDECGEWVRFLAAHAGAAAEILVDDDGTQIRGYEIRFASGKKIVALSSSPRNLRGKQGRAVLDEAAFHTGLRALIKAAMGFKLWGGDIRIISSHNGIDSPFNEMVIETREGKLPYSLHRVTFQEAVAAGLYKKICAARNQEWSDRRESDA